MCLSFSKICLSFFRLEFFLALSFFRNVQKKPAVTETTKNLTDNNRASCQTWPTSASNTSSVPPAPLGSSSSTCGGGGGSEVNIELDCESFRVRFVEETVHQGHSTLDFVVSSAHDDYELAVRIIHCPEWRQSLNTSQPHHPGLCPLTQLSPLYCHTQLSNLWWMPNWVSKVFDTAMKTGSSRRFKR